MLKVYDYECSGCGHIEEDVMTTYKAIHRCDKCGTEMTRALSAPRYFNEEQAAAKELRSISQKDEDKKQQRNSASRKTSHVIVR